MPQLIFTSTQFTQRWILYVLLILVVLTLTGLPRPVQAISGTVTDCTTFDDGNSSDPDTLGELLPGGGTIFFGCSGTIILPAGTQIGISVGTMLNANGQTVTIQGNGNRVFHVYSDASLTLNGLTVTGGSVASGAGNGGAMRIEPNGTVILQGGTIVSDNTSAEYGGGIANNGSLTVSNSTIENNTAVNDGGGIHNAGTLTVSNSTFAGNSAYLGGGILAGVGTVTVTNSTFSGNMTSGLAGGAGIMIVDATVTVSDSTFTGNTADGAGGALFNATGSLTLSNTAVSNNTAGATGGGIYNGGGTLNVSNSTLSDNTATGAQGGGIYNGGGTAIVENGTSVSGNSSGSYGGGIYNDGTLTVDNSTIANNTATNDGGGIINAGSLAVSDSTFSGNAAYLGGGILAGQGTVTVTNTIFSGNSTSGLAGGAGIMVVSATVTVSNSTFVDNTADGAGGALFNASGTLNMNSSTLSANTAFNGGGIYNGGSGTLNVSNSTLSGNSADNQGGAVYNEGGTSTIINSTLSGNSATNSGGGLHNSAGGTVMIKNSIVANSESGNNCVGTITDGGNNLSGDSTCNFGLINTDPMLGPLTNNGGLTMTHLPQFGSPALDAGNDTVCAAVPINNLDQRGQARPLDGNGDGIAHCDIGAVERRTPSALRINNGSGFESNTTTITFTVTRSGEMDITSTIDYATANGTATAGSDYVATSATLTFAPGVTTQSVVVTLLGDAVVEGNETFFVNLSNPTFATISDNQGQGTIRNSTVVLLEPTNNAFTKDNTPTFTWASIGTAVGYRLQAATTANFTSPALDVLVTTNSYTPVTALNDGRYYWRVQARNAANNWGSWNTRWIVTIDTRPPARPVLIAPANRAATADNTPTFRWNAVNGAVRYTLQMDDNSNFSSPIINRTLTTTSYTQASTLADKRYYWRVRAQDKAGNWSAWSTRWFFTLNAVPLAQPTPIPTNTPRPTLIPTTAATVVPTDVPSTTPTATITKIVPLLQVVESDQLIVQQSGTWTVYDDPSASGGTYLLSSTPADMLTMAFSGSEVTVVYIKHPAVGSFAVEVDGVLLQTVDSVAAETVFGAQVAISGLAYGQHTVKVYPVSGVVAIDAFRAEAALELVPTETPVPTDMPTVIPTVVPTDVPSSTPVPTDIPTDVPTETPIPTDVPIETPVPTDVPTETPVPTDIPTEVPMLTPVPTDIPTEVSSEVVLPAETTEEAAS